MKRTPLFDVHQQVGGKLIEFGGWEMPVQYTGIVDEHLAVRNAAGLFDISHMGEVQVGGAAAEWFLNRTLTNDVRKLAVGQGQYTLLCNDQGGVIDDLYIYRLADKDFLLIINASRIDQDVSWLRQQLNASDRSAETTFQNASDQLGAVAVQGPRVKEFIDKCFSVSSSGGTTVARVSDLKKNQIAGIPFDGDEIWIARTGYTGEDGFELVAPSTRIEAVWNRILAIGRSHGLKPAGLGARDTLRTEVCYPLYGHELDEQTTPLEAGLSFFVALDKGDFTGRARLAEQKAKGVSKRLVPFKMTGKSAPPRPGYPLYDVSGVKLGDATSGTQSPSLGIGIGMGYVPTDRAVPQTPIEVEIRGKRSPAVITSKPLYRKPA